jgi:hypothetical protein
MSYNGREYIPKEELYELNSGETVLFTLYGGQTYQEVISGKVFTRSELVQDPRYRTAWKAARERAVQIMTGPVDRYDDEQGLYDRVRVVPARNAITGRSDLGWTLIGIRKAVLNIEESI